MIMNEFFLDKVKYNALPLIKRMLFDIIAFKANYIFADTVINIIVKENPNYKDDPNEKCKIDHFRADRETAFECMYRYERLFESEYGELTDEVKANIKELAMEYANIPLIKFGWIKEKNA